MERNDGSDQRDATGRAIGALCRWAASVAYDDIPREVLASAALVLFDDLAAMVAAAREPEVVRLRDGMLRSSGPAEAAIFAGGGARADRYSAAVANGAAADWCELDEGYRPTSCHAGIYVLPALLAEAEVAALPASDVLRCLVIAYEVTTRFARGFPGAGRTLHSHGCFSAVGAAAAVALARGASAEGIEAAVTSAATMVSPGPRNHAGAGALVRNVWPAVGAWTGMRAADWAAFGITGLAASPYDVYVTGLGGDAAPEELTIELGEIWAITQNFRKLHACCQYLHGTVEATMELLQRHGDAPEDIAAITVAVHERAWELNGADPATTLAAKFSVPHAAAATAVLGHGGAEAFDAATLDDPRIAALRQKVEMVPFEPALPPPHDRPARVSWTLVDGTRREAECLSARGGPDRPFAAEEILAKIEAICDPVYPALGPAARRAIALDPTFLAEPWDRAVARITELGL